METFSILGTGWLGLALAKELKSDFKVKVSIRDILKEEEMIKEGLEPFFLDEENLENLDFLLDSNYVFINFPPSKSKDYIKFLENIYNHKYIKNCKKLIFISSSSIYVNKEGILNENSELSKTNSPLVFKAEMLIKEKTNVIFRCSGLMGANRIPGKYFAGKILKSKNDRVNYVYRDDIIKATKFVIENSISGIFNLCSQVHPTKKEIYLENAKKYGFKAAIFEDDSEKDSRLIDGSLIEKKGFEYDYPNPFFY